MRCRSGTFLVLLLGLAALGPSRGLAEPTRPSFLTLLSDDQRADAVGAWGNDHIPTPALDRATCAENAH